MDRPAQEQAPCCPHLHAAVELIGRRWSGAILEVLRVNGGLRFGELRDAVPGLSDRLCAERVRELEERGLIARHAKSDIPTPGRTTVTYRLTPAGRALEPALTELGDWARAYL